MALSISERPGSGRGSSGKTDCSAESVVRVALALEDSSVVLVMLVLIGVGSGQCFIRSG